MNFHQDKEHASGSLSAPTIKIHIRVEIYRRGALGAGPVCTFADNCLRRC